MNREAALKKKKKNFFLQKFYFKQLDFTIGKRGQLCHWHRTPAGWSSYQTSAELLQQPVAPCGNTAAEAGQALDTKPLRQALHAFTVSMAEAPFSYIKVMHLSLYV